MVQADSADAVSKAHTNPDSAAASTSGVDATIAKAAAEGGTLQEARLKSSEAKTCTRAGAEVSVLEASTPAGSASGVKEASTAQKPGSQTWFKKAGGILGRWTVPVKVKKEPKSKHLGMTDLIDLT